MDCRAFHKHHLAFVDDTLPGVDVGRMRDHLASCASCAAHDHRVRRSLLLVRNQLSPIQPSAEFRTRLDARLAAERTARMAPPGLLAPTPSRWSGAGMLAMVLALAAFSAVALSRGNGTTVARLPQVVVGAVPASGPSIQLPSATPAFVATMSTGMAILPALMLAEEVPVQRVSLDEGAAPTVRTAGLTFANPDAR